MSAIDDLIARDAAQAPAAPTIDALIAKDSASTPAQPQIAAPVGQIAPPQTPQPDPDASTQDLAAGGMPANMPAQLLDVLKGGAHGVGSLFSNTLNLAEKGIAAGANAIPGVQGSSVGNYLSNTANSDVAAQGNADQQFSQNASPGAQAAAVVTPMLLPMGGVGKAGDALAAGLKRFPGMGGVMGQVVANGAGNAATGALLSTGAPVDPSKPYFPQVASNAVTGGVLGAAVPAVFNAAKSTGSSLYNAVQPIVNPRDYVGSGLANAIAAGGSAGAALAGNGNDAAQVAQNIRSAPQFVPDSMPTTAQVGQGPLLVATEKAQANNNQPFKLALAQQEANNNGARWAALNGVAQTPQALDAAQAARSSLVAPLYDAAHSAVAPVDATFLDLAQRPAMQTAMSSADQLAKNEGVSLQWPTPNNPVISGQALDYTRRALGNQIGIAQRSGADQDVRALNGIANGLDSWSQQIPAISQAKQAYQQASVPINTMEAGQQIAGSVGGLGRSENTAGTPQLTASGYAGALYQALKQQKFGIDPASQQTLEGVGQDLQRATISNSLKSPGSDTGYNIASKGWLANQLYGPSFAGAGNAAKLAGLVGATALGHPMVGLGILGGGNKIGQLVGNRLNSRLNDLLLNPGSILPYLDASAASAVNGPQQSLASGLQRYVVPAAVGGVARSGLMNSR